MQTQDRLSLLSTAIVAALQAGDYFAARLQGEKTVKTKSSLSDLVTDVDPACESLIRETIGRAHPTHHILGEESVAPGAEASAAAVAAVASAPHLWIVDPLDGTTNFVYRIPLSTVSIGYAEQGELVAGVIYDPYRSELFLGMVGRGAFLADAAVARAWAEAPSEQLPGVRLSVSATRVVGEAVVATGFPTRGEMREKTARAGISLTNRVKNLRALGSAALHLAYVAAGRIDAFWEYDLNAWDLAAGALLVREASGCVAELSGAAYALGTRDVVAAATKELAQDVTQTVYL